MEKSMRQYPSIFNDVIGPVMVGPSSSHTAASVRIGRLLRVAAGGATPRRLRLTYDAQSSLAATLYSQYVAAALLAGVMGMDVADPAIFDAFRLAKDAGLEYEFAAREYGAEHPNTYHLEYESAAGAGGSLLALSVGGGMIHIREYQGFAVDISGGFYESLLICDCGERERVSRLVADSLNLPHQLSWMERNGRLLLNIKTESQPDWSQLPQPPLVLPPVLPVGSQLQPQVPFISAAQMEEYAAAHAISSLSELALIYECARSGFEPQQVLERMRQLLALLRSSLQAPETAGPPDRILPNQAHLLAGHDLLGGEFMRSLLYYNTRFMDIKTSLGVFVAAPTAGSCACLPGTMFALAEQRNLDDDALAKGMLAAGLVGVIIAHSGTFAAEVCGCQAECGSGSGMCAAACAEIIGLSAAQSLAAASLALQNVFGLTCDNIAGRVEVPCLGKNIMCALNAVAAANMAACGFQQVVPLDETAAALYQVGLSLPAELRCTSRGGLAVTPSGREIARRLAGPAE